jgi:hypothetical protein
MDFNAAANASISQSIAAQSVKPAHCRKCGSTRVAWAKGRNNRFYLVDATAGAPGKVIPGRTPHNAGTCERIQAENKAEQDREASAQESALARITRNRAESRDGDTYTLRGIRDHAYAESAHGDLDTAIDASGDYAMFEITNDRTGLVVCEQL